MLIMLIAEQNDILKSYPNIKVCYHENLLYLRLFGIEITG